MVWKRMVEEGAWSNVKTLGVTDGMTVSSMAWSEMTGGDLSVR
jgi:hypothetical protein